MLALRIDSLDPASIWRWRKRCSTLLEPGRPGWFLIWRNGPSIIVGRHQNTLEEINEDFVRAAGLSVVRRPPVGGRFTTDEGNINFSFLTVVDKNRPQACGFSLPHCRRPGRSGGDGRFSSRNDITVEGRKISGSAQRRSGSRMLHHGTMMVDLDAGILGKALTGNPDKYRSREWLRTKAGWQPTGIFAPGLESGYMHDPRHRRHGAPLRHRGNRVVPPG